MEAEEERINWSAEYSFVDAETAGQKREYLQFSPELLIELEGLNSRGDLPNGACELIFYSNGRYETRVDRSKKDVRRPEMNEVQHVIQELRTMDLAVMDIDVLKEHLGAVIPGYILNSPIIPKDRRLYRGVKWADRPLKTADLSYPPEMKVKTFHRAGRPGRPLFYCGTAREAPFFELGLISGDKVAISHWKTTAQLVVNNVGYHGEVFDKLSSGRDYPSWGKETEFHELEKTSASMRHFFATEFAKIVPFGQEHLYKISIAIAELHFSHEMFGGLLYPSMAMRANADNLALKPDCVDQYLKPHKVEYIRVDESSDHEFKVTILDFADTSGPDGKIQWKGRHPRWVMRQEGQVLQFTVENGRWVARNEQGEIVEPKQGA